MKNNVEEVEILYQGLNWHIGVDGLYINNTEKEPILNHLYEVALAYKSKSQECEELKEINAEIKESEIELENMKNNLFIDCMKYKQALDEIERITSKKRYFDTTNINVLVKQINTIGVDFNNILDVIDKAKEQE